MALSSRGGRSRFTLALLILTSLTVLTLDFRGSSAIQSLRSTASTVFSPVRDAAGSVFSPVGNAWNGLFHYGNVKKENDRLRAQIDDRGQAARTPMPGKPYDRLARGRRARQFTQIPAVTAQVISGPLTNFEHTIEIDRGSASGIKVGMPVVTGAGLVGAHRGGAGRPERHQAADGSGHRGRRPLAQHRRHRAAPRTRRWQAARRRRGHRPEGGGPARRARHHERRGPGDVSRRDPDRQGLEDRSWRRVSSHRC